LTRRWMTYCLILALTGGFFSCGDRIGLNETRWYLDIPGDCGTHFYFIRDSVVIYECEIPEKVFGTYQVEGKKIIIHTVRGEFDYEFESDSRHRHQPDTLNLRVEHDILVSEKNGLKYLRRRK
jgi:hypothetical protein